MTVTYRNFASLKFPLYILPSDDWYVQDGVLFLQEQVVDERKMPGKTLGIRRLQCGRKDLLPLKKAILNLPALIHTKAKLFIDSSGRPFHYEKEYKSDLKTYRIKQIDKKEIASVMWLYDSPAPFTLDRPPLGNPEYVRMLHYNGAPWIIYDYVREPPKNTFRRI